MDFEKFAAERKRMCDHVSSEVFYGCANCPLGQSSKGTFFPVNVLCGGWCVSNPTEATAIVAKWSAEHPEPVYPSLTDGWKEKFPKARQVPCPSDYFGIPCRANGGCAACKASPMHPTVAQKLGVEPETKERKP